MLRRSRTTCAVAGALLLTTSLILYSARDFRIHVREAVIVTAGARMLDQRHVALDDDRRVLGGT